MALQVGFIFITFFLSADGFRYKYATHGLARSEVVEKPVWEASQDVQLAVDCVHDKRNEIVSCSVTLVVFCLYII